MKPTQQFRQTSHPRAKTGALWVAGNTLPKAKRMQFYAYAQPGKPVVWTKVA